GAVATRRTVQVPPPAMAPPEKVMEPAPAAGANVGEPQPVVAGFGDAATTIAPGEVGKVSPKATPVRASFWFGLVMVKVSVDVPLARIGEGVKSLLIDGGSTALSDALARLLLFVPPSAVDTKPLTLRGWPAGVAVTLTETVQEPLAGIVPPLKVRVVLPAAGAQVAPAHVVAAAGVAATCTPPGRLSVKPALVRAAVFVFVRVK